MRFRMIDPTEVKRKLILFAVRNWKTTVAFGQEHLEKKGYLDKLV